MISPVRLFISFSWPALVSFLGYRKKCLSLSGAIFGIMVGFVLTLSNFCFSNCLVGFFISGSLLTRIGHKEKLKIAKEYKHGGERNWIQVFCNSSPMLLISLIYLIEVDSSQRELPLDLKHCPIPSLLEIAALSGLAGCTGDTWASEIGSAFGSKYPRLVTTWRNVPAGTNGAISFVGTVVSGLGGLFIGVVYYLTLILSNSASRLDSSPPQLVILLISTVAGAYNSFIDSFLGATLQYSGKDKKTGHIVNEPGSNVEHISGFNILDNHSVNLFSLITTSMMMPLIVFYTWPYLIDVLTF